MAYIGNIPAEKYVSLAVQHFTVTATDSYTLSNSVANENGVSLFINNVRQEPGSGYAYTAAGTTLTLSAATASTDTMYCVYLGKAIGTTIPPDGSVNSAKIVDGSVTNDDLAGSITESKLAGSIPSAKIADLDAAKLTGTVVDARISALTASKLTGTIDNARIALDAAEIPSLDAAKITTGTIADARFPATLPAVSGANLTGIAVAADLTQANNGIANLGLIMATDHNKVAFNLTNSFIDIFQDSSGITTTTNVTVDASEYVSTAGSTTTTGLSALTDMGSANFTAGGGTISGWSWGSGASSNDLTPWNGATETGGTTDGASTPVVFAADTEFEFHWYPAATSGYGPYVAIVPSSYYGTNDVNSTTNVMGTTGAMAYVPAASNYLRYNQSGSSSNVLTADYINTNCKFVRDSNNYIKFYSGGVLRYTSAATHSGAYEICISAQGGNASTAQNLQYKITTTTTVATTNATGTLISDTQTVASTTEVSGVFTYTDAYGANTIGTDLKIYVTADNGANWTDVGDTAGNGGGYGTATTFSGSIKQVKMGKSTVTAGTQVAIKAVWANQVASSKVAHLNGWAVNY